MTCDKIKKDLMEHFSLSDDAVSLEVLAHLDSCSDCRDYHNSLYQLRTQLSPLGDITLTAEESSRLRNCLIAAVAGDNMSAPARRVSVWRLTATAMIVLVMVFMFSNRLPQAPGNYDDFEQLSLRNVDVDQIDSLFADTDANPLPTLLEPAVATYVVTQVQPGQADNLFENVSKEELDWLASNFKMEI